MKKWIAVLFAGLLIWNGILTYLILAEPADKKNDSGNTAQNIVVDYSSDLSEMAADVRVSIVTVESKVNGLRRVNSGVVYGKEDESVYVFTCEQSGFDEGSLRVIFDSSASVEAQIVATDSDSGVSLLKVEPPFEVTLISTGSSAIIKQGESAVAIGGRSDMTGGAQISYGVVSKPAQRRLFAGASWLAGLIDIDANVTAEMTGGPLLNIGGQLIGVMVGRSYAGDRMASAVCSDELALIYDDFLELGKVSRGSLGCAVRSVNGMQPYEKSERNIKLDVTSGVLITYIADNAPAAEILEPGDVLLSMDGEAVSDEKSLLEMYYRHESGDEVILNIIRNSETMEVSVVLQ